MSSLIGGRGAPARFGGPRLLPAAMLGLLALASWCALWVWSASPYARYVAHDGWLDPAAFAALCRAVPAGTWLVPAALHAFGWLLMIAAMMLPSTYPVLGLFSTITRGRPRAAWLMTLLCLGYVAAWLGFGLLAHGLDEALVWFGARTPWIAAHGWLLAAAVLALAGAFQFSALKYRCLEQCHTPFAFVASRWRGREPLREALRIGWDHGVFCVGCCWALMLCMFVVGMGSLGWMLVLALLMSLEKNLRGGLRLRYAIGGALFAAAAAVSLGHG